MPIEHKHIGLHELKQNTLEDINAVYKKAYNTENYMQKLDSLNAVTSISVLVENGSILTCCTYRDRLDYVVMENLVSIEVRNGHASRFVREFLPEVSKSLGKVILMAAEEKDIEWYRALMTDRNGKRVQLLNEYRRILGQKYIGETRCTWTVFYCKKSRIRYDHAFILYNTSNAELEVSNDTESINSEVNVSSSLPLKDRLLLKRKHVSRTSTPIHKRSGKFPPSHDY